LFLFLLVLQLLRTSVDGESGIEGNVKRSDLNPELVPTLTKAHTSCLTYSLLVSLLREQGELHMLVAGGRRITSLVRIMLRLSNQRYSLIEDGGCLPHITADFSRIGQHPREFPLEFFLGFFVILVSLADATDQTDFLVFVVGLIDSRV
jgi:hypothetical protein